MSLERKRDLVADKRVLHVFYCTIYFISPGSKNFGYRRFILFFKLHNAVFFFLVVYFDCLVDVST